LTKTPCGKPILPGVLAFLQYLDLVLLTLFRL
jgi:hypothetical protein